MLVRSKSGLYQSDMLTSQKGVIHGFSSRALGDMRTIPPRQIFKDLLGVSAYRLVGAQQVHGNRVRTVTLSDYGKTVPDVDGLVFRQQDGETPVVLGVIAADCVPVLFVDTKARIIGAAHAGWRGTRDHIAANVVQSMVNLGADPNNIYVTLGPYIGPCCYTVPQKRATEFRKSFRNADVVDHRNNSWYLDLGKANIETLLSVGVQQSHISQSLLCTFEHIDQLYSYRKETRETYGEQMGMIALSV